MTEKRGREERGPGRKRKPRGERAAERRRGARRPRRDRGEPRRLSADLRRLASPIAAVATEILKLARELVVVPAQAFMYVAELAGAAVLSAYRRIVRPSVSGLIALGRAALRFGQRHVTPARGVGAVAALTLVALIASQWLDFRSISVGTDAYSGTVGAVAPPPDVDTERAGDGHAWAMVPLAVAGFAVLGLAARRGRAGLARLLILIGVAVLAISLLVDLPQALDEGEAAVAYEGAEGRVLEGFWAQLAIGAVLVVCGAVLPRYLRGLPERKALPRRRRVELAPLVDGLVERTIEAGKFVSRPPRAGGRLKRPRRPRPPRRLKRPAMGRRAAR